MNTPTTHDVYTETADGLSRLITRYPVLMQSFVGHTTFPYFTNANAEAIASDAWFAYYGNKNKAKPHTSGMNFTLFNKAQLAAIHEIARLHNPEIKPLFNVNVTEPVDRKWWATYVGSSDLENMKLIYRDLLNYISIYKVVNHAAVEFRALSQYPFNIASWVEIARDLSSLVTRLRALNVLRPF